MSVDWQTFKYYLGSLNVNIAYIDDEGSEIPIENECEFEEAIKFAKNYEGNQLYFIIKFKDKNKATDISAEKNSTESSFIIKAKKKAKMNDQIYQCECKNENPPLWFTNYMKKFKRKLIEEVKCNIHEAIKPALSEIKKLKVKKEIEKIDHEAQYADQEKIYSNISKKISHVEHKSSDCCCEKQSNSKKLSVKDSSDILKEQRDLKLLKKYDKLSSTSRNAESSIGVNLLNEKIKTEKKSQTKSKLENKSFDINWKVETTNKTWYCHKETVVTLSEKFTFCLLIYNDFEIPWQNLTLRCSPPKGFSLEKKIKLPAITCREYYVKIVTGKASKKTGKYLVQFDLYEGDFLIGWYKYPVVVTKDFFLPISQNTVKTIKKKEMSEDTIEKIEEKLEGINLEHTFSSLPNTASPNLKEKNTEEKGTNVFENLEKNFLKEAKASDKNEEVFIYTQPSSNKSLDFSKNSSIKIETGTEALSDKNYENLNLIDLNSSSSDSEMSILRISEGEESEEEVFSENFVFLPLPQQEKIQFKDQATETNLSPAREESTVSTDFKEPLILVNSKCEGKDKILKKEKEKKNKKFFQRNRSPVSDDRKSCRTKKLKSFKSSEYQFKATDLTRPSLSIYVPCSNLNKNEKTFTFTGERLTSPVLTEKNKIPTIDSLGKTIYAVSSKGNCLPVETIIKNVKETKKAENNKSECDSLRKTVYAVSSKGYCVPFETLKSDKKTRNAENTKIPSVHILPDVLLNGASNIGSNKSASVNILPDALMSGASNMASLAINTAKSVISNLQSALVKEGTELGKTACEPKKASMEALYKLYEMGFTDLQVNRNLLLQLDNDLSKVVEELILLEQKCKKK